MRPRLVVPPIGSVVGRLTVISEPFVNKDGRHRHVTCRCDCNTVKTFRMAHLSSGAVQSCGCYRRQHATKHGARFTETYETWSNMIMRCHNPKNKAYERYGARGIVVCDRWRLSFVVFLEDMGERPPGLTLERIDNNGDYAPENCRWATRTEQQRNTRRNRLLTFRGETLPLAVWAERLGIRPQSLAKRLTLGWSVERTLTTHKGH